jgi:hypothetical protein
MSASVSGALKALIESAGLSLTADRDQRSKTNTAVNWVTISEGISTVPASINTPYDPLGPKVVSELAQVDLWQKWRDSDNNVVESPALARSLIRTLDGARLPTSPTRTWGVTVRSFHRMPPEQEANLIHTAITVQLIRNT